MFKNNVGKLISDPVLNFIYEQACSEPDDIKASYIDAGGNRVEVPKSGNAAPQRYVLSADTGFTCENADQRTNADTGEAEECFDYQVQLCCKGRMSFWAFKKLACH